MCNNVTDFCNSYLQALLGVIGFILVPTILVAINKFRMWRLKNAIKQSMKAKQHASAN